jgi:hypothetical protein
VRLRSAVTSGVLIALAAGALGYAYVFDRHGVSDADRAARAGRVFPRFDLLGVSAITLDRGSQHLHLDRAGDAGSPTWTMTSPRTEAADPAAVDALLEDMSLAMRVRAVTLGPAATGLASPRVSGRVSMAGADVAFALGAPAPVPDGAAYMSVEGEGVFVVDQLLAEDLLRGADAYRDRALVPFGASEVARVEVKGPGPEGMFALTRAGVTFRLDGSLRASRGAIERLFAALAEVRADSFVDGGDAGGEGSADALSVAVDSTSPSRARVELRFGGPCPGNAQDVVVVAASPARRSASACVPKAGVDPLRSPRATFIDDAPFHARADEIAELRLEPARPTPSKGDALDLARRGSGWHERSPQDRDLDGPDADAANALADRLIALRATDVRAGSADESFPARSRVTLVRVDGAIEVVEVSPPGADGSLRARRVDDGAVLTMPGKAARDLEARSLK